MVFSQLVGVEPVEVLGGVRDTCTGLRVSVSDGGQACVSLVKS